jgi:hypothetical protein
MRIFLEKNVVEITKIHILHSKTCLYENRGVCEMMGKSVVEADRLQYGACALNAG